MTTWAELVRLMGQAHVLSARGVWRGFEPPDDDDEDKGVETAEAQPREEVQRFIYQHPNRWRISALDGRTLRLCDGERSLLWGERDSPPAEYSVRGSAWRFSPDPLDMLRPSEPDDWSRDDDYSRPLADPVAAIAVGRSCWRVDLAPPAHKTGNYSIWVDAETGIRLRAENSVFGLLEEFVELELDVPVDPIEFAYDGAVDRSEQEARDRDETARRHYQDNPPPTPTFWPRGLDSHVWEGDATTGTYVVRLEVPGSALLARHRLGDPEWAPPYTQAQVHRWQDDQWRWTLVVDGEPLTPSELERVIASIPIS